MNHPNGAVVLLSGGQDSAYCAAHTCLHYDEVVALSVDYGQRHQRELDAADAIAQHLGLELLRAGLALPDLGDALTGGGEITTRPDGLPSTFVPGRNAMLLALAAGLAVSRGWRCVVIGCSQVDYSGYPDCRRAFLEAQKKALSLALDVELRVYAPLLDCDKADTVRLARMLPEAWEALALSWTCYLGGERPCDDCPACKLRAKGFAEAGFADPAR